MSNLYKIIFVYLLIISIATSCLRVYMLGDNITKVPLNEKVYMNSCKFDPSVFKFLDTSVLYERYDMSHHRVMRLSKSLINEYYDIYRFYPNGHLNYFLLNSKKTNILLADLDPLHTGYRGVYFKKGEKMILEIFVCTSEIGLISKTREYINVKEDTLYIKRDGEQYERVYVKLKFPLAINAYNDGW